MYTQEEQKNLLTLVLNSYAPVGMKKACAAVRCDFSVILQINMIDGTDIYGIADPHNHITILDAWDWLSEGGIYVLARERGVVMEPKDI